MPRQKRSFRARKQSRCVDQENQNNKQLMHSSTFQEAIDRLPSQQPQPICFPTKVHTSMDWSFPKHPFHAIWLWISSLLLIVQWSSLADIYNVLPVVSTTCCCYFFVCLVEPQLFMALTPLCAIVGNYSIDQVALNRPCFRRYYPCSYWVAPVHPLSIYAYNW